MIKNNTPHSGDKKDTVYTVSRLNAEVRRLLCNTFGFVRVVGEISGFKRYPSGHAYFSLKDKDAEIRCVMFQNKNRKLNFKPEDGLQAEACAAVELYTQRGQFQLIIETLSPVGDGLLLRKIEELKKRLISEGLFAGEHKQTLPFLPRVVGVITSPSGAVLHDITHTLKQRCPLTDVVVYPGAVQGAAAVSELCSMLALANRKNEADVLILARGGGSLEDLMAFNSEQVARAIFASQIPVITGIGHEPDYSIADAVADHSAPTPTAAAQTATPDKQQLQSALDTLAADTHKALNKQLDDKRRTLYAQSERLQANNPRMRVGNAMQRLDEHTQRIQSAMANLLTLCKQRIEAQQNALRYNSPQRRLVRLREHLTQYEQQLRRSITLAIAPGQEKLAHYKSQLELVNPAAVLKRGYTITRDESGHVITSVDDVRTGEKLAVQLKDGGLDTRVERVTPQCRKPARKTSPGKT